MLRAENASASPLDAEAHALLLSADRIEAVAVTAYDNGNGAGLSMEPYEKSLGDFPPARLRSWIKNLGLIPRPENPSWGSDTIPSLYLVFYKSKKEIASLNLDYGDSPNTFLSSGQKRILYRLQPKSAFALRKIAARQPQFIKAMIKLGAKTQDMAPQRAYEAMN